VRLWEEGGALCFEVDDDGAGFDVENKTSRTGLTNMSDRLGAVGGTLLIESSPGVGTRVRGTVSTGASTHPGHMPAEPQP